MSASFVKHSGVIVPQSDLRGGTAKDQARPRKINHPLKIATWNVRTLLQCGKLENLKLEMDRMEIDALGISEMRWPEPGDFWSGDYRIIYTGTNQGTPGVGGVGVILNKKLGNLVKGYVQYSSRIILVKLETKPKDTVIVQVYMPTCAEEEDIVETIYEDVHNVINYVKGEENLIIVGDWNASVGEEQVDGIVGNFGLGSRNERGCRLIEFCAKHKLVVANTLFNHHKRRRYTWKAPGDVRRQQIDYILVKARFRNQIKDCRSYPSADIYSDHNLVMMKCLLRLKRLRKKVNKTWNRDSLKSDETTITYAQRTDAIASNFTHGSANEEWIQIRNGIHKAAEEVVGQVKPVNRKEWITPQIVCLIEERRLYKNASDEQSKAKYKGLRNQINRECRKAKESYLNSICEEVEGNMVSGKTDIAYRTAKRLFKKQHIKFSGTIKNREGELLFGEDVLKRWQEYIEELYQGAPLLDNEIESNEEVDEEELGEDILEEEFEKALHDLPDRKAAGPDDIPSELIKKAGGKMKAALLQLTRKIYTTGEVPEDFQKCIMVPIPKKASATKCEEYRTLSLLSHASKILIRIILKRAERKLGNTLSEDQFGFRRGVGTREAILSLRLLIEKQMSKSKKTYMAFVDLEKAFDNVVWPEMFRILEKVGLTYNDRRIIFKIYQNETALIRHRSKEETARIRKGVRQGCPLSPIIFNAYIQEAIDKVRENANVGVNVNGVKIDMLRYADDIVIVAEGREDLEFMLHEMERTFKDEYGMKINKRKTKVMVCGIVDRNERIGIKIDEEELGQVTEFSYLGSKITEDGRSKADIMNRIQLAKIAFNDKKDLLTCRNVSLKTRKRVMEAYVWSVALYGCETWTIGKQEKKRLEALEMWCYRRMQRVSWKDRVTNEEVLMRVQGNRTLWRQIQYRRVKLIGHILRHNDFVKLIAEGLIEGTNRRGRPRLSYMRQIMCDVGCFTYVEMKRKADLRAEWRAAANQPSG